MKLLIALLLCLALCGQQPKPEPPKERAAEAPKAEPRSVPLTQEQILRYSLLLEQLRNLQLQVCVDARIWPERCEIVWGAGMIVEKPEPPKKPESQPKP